MTSLEKASTIETIETGFSPDNSFVPHLPTHVQDGVSNMKLTEVLRDWTGSITDVRGLQGLLTCMTPLTLEEGVVGSENAPRTLWDQLEPVLHHESFSQLSRDKQETVAGAVGTVLWTLANAPQERVVRRGESRDVSQRVRDAADEAYKRLETSIENMPPPSRALPGGKTALRVSQALVAASLLVGCTPKAPISAVEIFSNENRPKVVLDSGTEAAVGFSTVPAEQPSPIVIDNTPTKVESPTPPATATPTETETQEPTPLKTETKIASSTPALTETKIASSTPSPTIEASPSPAEAPKKQELPSWAKPYFYYELPAWGVDVNKLNPSEKLEIKDKLGSGRYFFDGNLSDLIQTYEKQHQYVTGYGFQLTGSRFEVVIYHGTKQKIDAYIESRFKDASPAKIAALKQREIALAEAFMNEFRDKEGIHMKTSLLLLLQKYDDTVEWTMWQNDGKSVEKTTKFLGILNIPIP